MKLAHEMPLMARLREEMDAAERRAWEQLSGGHYLSFARWVAIWVKLNEVGRFRDHNPFTWIVEQVRERQQQREARRQEGDR